MQELPFLLEEIGHSGFQVQIDQIHGMGEFIHQPAKQAIEALGGTTADSDV